MNLSGLRKFAASHLVEVVDDKEKLAESKAAIPPQVKTVLPAVQPEPAITAGDDSNAVNEAVLVLRKKLDNTGDGMIAKRFAECVSALTKYISDEQLRFKAAVEQLASSGISAEQLLHAYDVVGEQLKAEAEKFQDSLHLSEAGQVTVRSAGNL